MWVLPVFYSNFQGYLGRTCKCLSEFYKAEGCILPELEVQGKNKIFSKNVQNKPDGVAPLVADLSVCLFHHFADSDRMINILFGYMEALGALRLGKF